MRIENYKRGLDNSGMKFRVIKMSESIKEGLYGGLLGAIFCTLFYLLIVVPKVGFI